MDASDEQLDEFSGTTKLLASVILVIVTLGCLPIPSERDVLIRPEATYRLQTDEEREPVEEATLRLCRIQYGPPPTEVVDTWSRQTDERGMVSFSHKHGTETVYPLWMHGVPAYKWAACVEADGYDVIRRYSEDGEEIEPTEYPVEKPYNTDKIEYIGKGGDTVELFLAKSGEGEKPTGCPCDRVFARKLDRPSSSGATSGAKQGANPSQQ